MNKEFHFSGFSSLAVHGGHQKDPNYAHLTPIYATSTFVYDDAEQGMRRFSGQEEGYIYSRWGNPTREVLAETRAELEGGAGCVITATGRAAVDLPPCRWR